MTEEEKRRRLERLSVDIDTRLSDVWEIVWSPGSVLLPVLEDERVNNSFGTLLRAAYAAGYRDALHEDSVGRRDELARANGYRASCGHARTRKGSE